MIKGILIDVHNENVKAIEIEKDLKSYYNILKCDCIDIVSRRIGDKYYDIICDDEGLLKESPKISAVNRSRIPMFVGNLFIVRSSGDDVTDLDKEDLEYIMDHVRIASSDKFPSSYPVLIDVEY
jgi:hypothetical protein